MESIQAAGNNISISKSTAATSERGAFVMKEEGRSSIRQDNNAMRPISPPDLKDAKNSPTRGHQVDEFPFNPEPPSEKKKQEENFFAMIGLSPPRKATETNNTNGDIKVNEKQKNQKDFFAMIGLSPPRAMKSSDDKCANDKKTAKKHRLTELVEVITVAEGIEAIKLSEKRNHSRDESFGLDVDLLAIMDEPTTRTDTRSKGFMPDDNPEPWPKSSTSSKSPKSKEKDAWWKKAYPNAFKKRHKNMEKSNETAPENSQPNAGDRKAMEHQEEKQMEGPAGSEEFASPPDIKRDYNGANFPPLDIGKHVTRAVILEDTPNPSNSSTGTVEAHQTNGRNRTFWASALLIAAFGFLWKAPFTTRLVDSACGPVAHGTVLAPDDNASFEAPWVVPAPLKSDAVFRLICGWNRPRMKLDWIPVKKHHQMVLSELKSDGGEVVVEERKNVVSAMVIELGVLIEDKRGKEHVLLPPWHAFGL